jgi:preprotein translocase subunit YajC
MDFLIPMALAQGDAPRPLSGLADILFIVVMFLMVYLIVIRPQSKRAKEHKKLLETLSRGDEVVTQGGVLGRVADLGENFVLLEISENVKVKVQRQAISMSVPKGTLKSL